MKKYCLIIILLSILVGSIGCASANFSLHENQLHGMKPLMERTPDEEKINISVPVYKF